MAQVAVVDSKKIIGWQEIIAIVVFVVVLFFIFKPSGEKKDTKKDTELTVTATDKKVTFAFNRTAYAPYIKTKGFSKSSDYLKSKGLTGKDINTTVNMIKSAKGTFNDDEDKLYDVFRAIPNLCIFSMVSNIFYYVHKIDLREFLIDFMNEKEMSKLYKIIIAKYYL